MTVLMVLSLVATVVTGMGSSKGNENMGKYHKVAAIVFVCLAVLHAGTKLIAKVM